MGNRNKTGITEFERQLLLKRNISRNEEYLYHRCIQKDIELN